MEDFGIRVSGAREHNLQNISVVIPRNQITVVTGVSGSGKSSLAFDVIYAEGQRRYLDSLSSYSRNYMVQVKKPDVDSIKGLSPSVAINQKTISTNPRSTVGTLTEIYDYIRLLYARVGKPFCPIHKQEVSGQSVEHIVQSILSAKKGSKFYLFAPVATGKKGEFQKEIAAWIKLGYVRAKIDGQLVELANIKKLSKTKKHDISINIDRLIVDDKYKSRLTESVHSALELSKGFVTVEYLKGKSVAYSNSQSCAQCGYSFPTLEPNVFSFNSPRGACEACDGLGILIETYEIDGEEFDETIICDTCDGKRLKEAMLNVFINEYSIADLVALPCNLLLEQLSKFKFTKKDSMIVEPIIAQIKLRLEYISQVGVNYLSLDRRVNTLSGGEVQRVRLATQLGSQLVGVLYVLDEPSIGLHPRDHDKLLKFIKEIRNRGNTIILVEHDEETILTADYVIDLGPGAGIKGGHIQAQGTVKDIKTNKNSLTGQYISGKESIPVPTSRRKGNGQFIEIIDASLNNLKKVHFKLPLGVLAGVSGVSGSGKSSLVIDTLFYAVSRNLLKKDLKKINCKSINGLEHIDKVIQVNQRPIGRTPRSIPATYIGLFSAIRNLFAHMPESKMRGYKPGYFSFNVKGGRCEQCEGYGLMKVEMNFLSNVYVECDVCFNKRYSSELLNIRYKEKNISDVLKMSVDEAYEFFINHKFIANKLLALKKVGLGYISLGQSSTTISGGEAQRIKLAKELSKRSTKQTLYILDEPTTGLHFADVKKLIELLHEIVEQGNTVLVIEHNMDVIKNFDYMFDIGPEGGSDGGKIVAQGTPEAIVKKSKGATALWLKKVL